MRPHGILVTANRAFEVFNEGVDPALLEPPTNMFRHAPADERTAAVLRRRWA